MTRLLLHLLFFLSGAAALGYQIVWAKMFSTGLGHEMPAVLAIICAFMGGMALGAALLDRHIPRSLRAGRWLAGLEAVIALWALLAGFFIPHLNEFMLRMIGPAPAALKHWLIVFALPALALLPATAAMGATLPAMEKFLSALAPLNASVGRVYAANTFGAVAGTLLAPFVLMPAFGLSRTCWALAAVNLLAGAGVAWLARAGNPELQPGRASRRASGAKLEDDRGPFPASRVTVTLFITGLLGLVFETAGVRVLSQVLEGTIYTYAAVLAVFLLGTAAGAAAYHLWIRKRPARRTMPLLFYGTGMACMTGLFALMFSGWIYEKGRQMGDSLFAVLLAEMLTASAVFLLPTLFMGAVFSQLTQMMRAVRGDIGRAVAANTLGAALAPVLVVVFLPTTGTKWLLFATAFAYFFLCYPARPSGAWLIPFLLTVAMGYNARLQMVQAPPGGRVAEYREGVMASVAVLVDTNDHRTLRVDNRFQMGGTSSADAEYRQAHLPLLLHPAPGRALFLGVGTGISLGASSLYPELLADGVELIPEVIAAMPWFAPQNFSAHQHPRLKIHCADARRFVRVENEAARYDVIIGDLFHPYRDGAGALYTREHFAAVRGQLSPAPEALFWQWLPLHQIDVPTLRTMTRTFQAVFPTGEAWLLRFNVDVPVVALVGGRQRPRWTLDRVESRSAHEPLTRELRRLALADSLRLYGHRLAGPEELREFAGDAPLNTDDDQRVTFTAARAAYDQTAKPYASLLAMLAVSKPEQSVAPMLSGPGAGEFAKQFSAYLAARNVYLHGLVHQAEERQPEALDAFVESARLSADFTPGYAQGVTFATLIAASDPARARRILERLVEAQPRRPLAQEMLQRLFPN